MKKEIKLYRGDSLPKGVRHSSRRQRGQTFAQHFCGNGVMAKFSNGGSNRLLHGRELIDLVLAHVGYEAGTPEQELADHSPLISFSEDKESAFTFSNRKKCTLQAINFYEATHFIWQFDALLEHELSPGRYAFEYQADSSSCRKTVSNQVGRGYEDVSNGGVVSELALPLMDLIAGAYADADSSWHYAEIVDVITFLNSQDITRRDEKLVNQTFERASRDKEWLIYPMDPMPDGLGYSSRFQMNAALSICQCFKLKNSGVCEGEEMP